MRSDSDALVSPRWTVLAAGVLAVMVSACGGSGASSSHAPVASPSSAANNRAPGTQTTTDACALVSAADAQSALGETAGPANRGAKTSPTPVAAGPVKAATCSYPAASTDGASLNVTVRSYPSVEAATAEFASVSHAGQPLSGIGDRAVLSSGRTGGTASDELIAQKGKVILDLLLNSSTSKQKDPEGTLKALATKALARL
jgi:Protein of unknown function (DUF3558)